MFRTFRPLLLLPLALLAACASSAMVTGRVRPPIDPAQVRIYYGAPTVPYEEIARLDVSSGGFTYGEENKTNAVLERLRKQAASVGANGVIFQRVGDGYSGGGGVSVGAGGGSFGGRGYGGVGVGVNISPRQKYGSGIAIHVPNPPPVN